MNIPCLRASIHTLAEISYVRSSGPGGQHVNKVNTKVTLRLNLSKLEGLSEAEMNRVRQILAPRLIGTGELMLTSSETPSQKINLERAFSRIETLIVISARLPKHRRPTKPSKALREKRLRSKRLQGLKKSTRRFNLEE